MILCRRIQARFASRLVVDSRECVQYRDVRNVFEPPASEDLEAELEKAPCLLVLQHFQRNQ